MKRVPLHNKLGEVVAWAKVDDEDYNDVMIRRWHRDVGGYARSCLYIAGGGHENILMQRLITGLQPGDPRQADHENRNRLDNQKHNLRITDNAGNGQNTCARPDRANAAVRTSRFRGVAWFERRQKWRALVTVAGKQHSGGYHEEEVDAALAAQALRDKLVPMAMPDPELAKLQLESTYA